MIDPVKIQTIGIDKMNAARIRLHRTLCSRYKLDHDTTKKFTDNIPTSKSFEECCMWLHNELSHNSNCIVDEDTDNSFCFRYYHDLYYLFGDQITNKSAMFAYRKTNGFLKWALGYTARDSHPDPLDRNAITRAYKCCIYLSGLPDKLQPSDEIMKSAAIKSLNEALKILNDFRFNKDPDDEYSRL